MKKSIHVTLLALACAAGTSFVYAACSDDDTAVKESPDSGIPVTPIPTQDGGGPPGTTINPDGGTLPDGAPADCVQNPTTYLEIINGCVGPGVTRIEKNPTLARVLPDGGLPPLH